MTNGLQRLVNLIIQKYILTKDIKKVNPLKLNLKKIDGIIGGPPCQGFSLSGNRDTKDPRNSLFIDFVRFVKILKPKFFVMENVKGLLSMTTKKNILVKEIIKNEFNKVGYNLDLQILNSADYGVPQLRQRIFFIGILTQFGFFGDNEENIKEGDRQGDCRDR